MAVAVIVELLGNDGKLAELESPTLIGKDRRNALGEFTLDFPTDELADEGRSPSEVRTVAVRTDERRSDRLWAGRVQPIADGTGGGVDDIDTAVTTLEGSSLPGLLAGRLLFPDHTTTEPWSAVSSSVTGPGSTAVCEFVRREFGDLALPERYAPQVSWLDPSIGTTGTWTARLERLDQLVHRICEESGIVLDMRLIGTDDYQVATRSPLHRGAIVVDEDDMATVAVRTVPPRATWVLGAGSGEGIGRVFASSDDGSTGLDRIEQLYELTNVSDPIALERAARTRREQLAGRVTIEGEVSEPFAAERLQWRRHYEIGDTFDVRVRGVRFRVRVEGVAIEVSAARARALPAFTPVATDVVRGQSDAIAELNARFEAQIA